MNEQKPLVKRVITVTGVEQKLTAKGLPVTKIKDEKGLNYNIYKLKKDGTESIAHQTLAKMPGLLGSQIEVAFAEDKADMNGKEITFRTVRIINEVNQESNPQQGVPSGGQNGSLTNENTNQVYTQPNTTSSTIQGNTEPEIDTDNLPF